MQARFDAVKFMGLCVLRRAQHSFRNRPPPPCFLNTLQLPFKAGMATESTDAIIPDGLSLHVENTTKILLDPEETFLNPVQEFNRDLSVAAIRVWSEERNGVKEAIWLLSKEKKIHARKRLKCTFPFSLSSAKLKQLSADNGQPTDPHGTASQSVKSTGDVPKSYVDSAELATEVYLHF